METTGLDLSKPEKSYDDVVRDAHPIKYLMKMAPISKSVVTYLALFNADWAKEQDITVSSDNTIR